MSLDVYLIGTELVSHKGSGIFIRENGQTKEISREEWNKRWPDREPVMTVADIETCEVFHGNITHNLYAMAKAADLYEDLWEPGVSDGDLEIRARDLIEPLSLGLLRLLDNPDHFKTFNPPNGWGTYETLVQFVREYLIACIKFPHAKVEISR